MSKPTPASFPLRMEPEVRAALEERCVLRGSSMNSEINELLKLGLGQASNALSPAPVDLERTIEQVVLRSLERYGLVSIKKPAQGGLS